MHTGGDSADSVSVVQQYNTKSPIIRHLQASLSIRRSTRISSESYSGPASHGSTAISGHIKSSFCHEV